jgi:hypothetical protein
MLKKATFLTLFVRMNTHLFTITGYVPLSYFTYSTQSFQVWYSEKRSELYRHPASFSSPSSVQSLATGTCNSLSH